ncbi:MAG: hypothetical protein RDU30_03895 [Desulfovibrionaceae bacterium]|nr:hypothetical protein [Desulfovibrionaceae bacterium]
MNYNAESCLVHVSFAVLYFFIVNLIGKHSSKLGEYEEITLFSQTNSYIAYNFVFRVAAPALCLILTALLLYHINFDQYIFMMWTIVVYYYLIRIMLYYFTGKFRLLNWTFQLAVMISSVLLSLFIYEKILLDREYFYPTKSDIISEVWLIVVLFIYSLLNKLQISDKNNSAKAASYINFMHRKFRTKYKNIIDKSTDHEHLKSLIYAIMIYENFNRPFLFRLIEKFKVLFTESTVGVMQIKTNKCISDETSVRIAAKMIVKIYNQIKNTQNCDESDINNLLYDVSMKYNPCSRYASEVRRIYEIISTDSIFIS